MTGGGARGFTLIEVLVALAILAIALGALVKGGGANAANAAHLRDKSLAHWVAMNRVAEVQLEPGWPGIATTRGTAGMAGREWQWVARVSDTFDGDVRRLEVEVGEAGREEFTPLEKLIAFLPRPGSQNTGSQGAGGGGGNE